MKYVNVFEISFWTQFLFSEANEHDRSSQCKGINHNIDIIQPELIINELPESMPNSSRYVIGCLKSRRLTNFFTKSISIIIIKLMESVKNLHDKRNSLTL